MPPLPTLPAPTLTEHQVLLLVVQLAVLLLLAHLFGEGMRKLGQPPVVGQLVAGLVLGRSLLGAVWPHEQAVFFAAGRTQGELLQVVSWLGVLFLLTLTGLETDAELIRRQWRAAAGSSLLGLALPFAGGAILGWLAPASLLAAPDRRLVFSLFVGTAMLISSVPVVARILSDMRLMRRDVGQAILATAIVSDAVGWIAVSLVASLAKGHGMPLAHTLVTIVSTTVYVVGVMAWGRRAILTLLRWIHATVRAEEVLLGMVVVLVLTSAGITQALGAHAVLGAFVIGAVLRQSPILGDLVTSRFYGMTMGVFAPVFFAAAGIYVDLGVLCDPRMLVVTLATVATACFTKVVGCYLGGRLGGLGRWEALSVGIGSNARGAMGLILALLGLSLGILTVDAYSVLMITALFTTIITPPLLTATLARAGTSAEEESRLAHERLREASHLGALRRVLLPSSGGPDALAAARILRYLGEFRPLVVSPMWVERAASQTKMGMGPAMPPSVLGSLKRALGVADSGGAAPLRMEVRPLAIRAENVATAVVDGAAQGYYSLIALGCGHDRPAGEAVFGRVVDDVIRRAPCAVLVVRAPAAEAAAASGGADAEPDGEAGRSGSAGAGDGGRPLPAGAPEESAPRRILVPVTGVAHSRRAAELAVLVARATGASIQVLHIVESLPEGLTWSPDLRETSRYVGLDLVEEVALLAEAFGIPLATRVQVAAAAGPCVVEEARTMAADLVVMGALRRSAARLFLGPTLAYVLEHAPGSLAVLVS